MRPEDGQGAAPCSAHLGREGSAIGQTFQGKDEHGSRMRGSSPHSERRAYLLNPVQWVVPILPVGSRGSGPATPAGLGSGQA